MQSILGLSLGPRSMGIAIFSYGDLIKWSTHTFPGPWGKSKGIAISERIANYIERNSINVLAVKIPSELRHLSLPMQKALGVINSIAERKGLQVFYYSLVDLKQRIPIEPCKSKRKLVKLLVEKYPDLIPIYEAGLSDGKTYYLRAIEAIGCAHLCYREQFDCKANP